MLASDQASEKTRQINIQPENTVQRLVRAERREQENERMENNLYGEQNVPEDALVMWLLLETLFSPQWFSVFHFLTILQTKEPDKLTLPLIAVSLFTLDHV